MVLERSETRERLGNLEHRDWKVHELDEFGASEGMSMFVASKYISPTSFVTVGGWG